MITNLAGRAKAGGETGVNGEAYKGGQFLPSTQAPKGTHTVMSAPPLDDAELAARAERKAQRETEQAAHEARCAAVAADPRTLWLANWLTETFTRPGYQGLLEDGHWHDETDSWDHNDWIGRGLQVRSARIFTSGFARDMHANLTCYGKLPGDLSKRQFQVLAEMYAKAEGARRGSRRYNERVDDFYFYALEGEE